MKLLSVEDLKRILKGSFTRQNIDPRSLCIHSSLLETEKKWKVKGQVEKTDNIKFERKFDNSKFENKRKKYKIAKFEIKFYLENLNEPPRFVHGTHCIKKLKKTLF